VRSAPLLAPFGLHAPLQAVRGYHVEMCGAAPYFEAPLVYTDERVIVTPMTGRLRATSFMEFADADAPPDPRKPARLRQILRRLGYACELQGSSWMGSRPVLPDYLPGIGRAPGFPKLFYAIGHQHIGLTLAPITAELIADLVAERAPRIAVAAYDLTRF
jgi:glycine/D-amino acid oxidase-like deaminating enzyme